ncbi:MAG: hypothetical protein ACON4I_04655 [Candidatus Puniceispirillaceae bacterium]
MFFNQLELNHIGVIVAKDDFERIATSKNCELIEDKIQGVRVFFELNTILQAQIEYIAQEGRVANAAIGYNHSCYNIKDQQHLDRLHNMMKDTKTGFRLTFPERSAAREYCNLVAFYKTIYGIVEFNIVN